MDKNLVWSQQKLELPDPICNNFRFVDIIIRIFDSYERVYRSE